MPFPGGSDDKESASNMGNPGLIPGSGRPPGEGGGHPFSYSCLENPMGGGAWWATVDGVAQSLGMEWLTLRWDTRLSVLRSECIQTHKQQKWPWTSGQPAPPPGALRGGLQSPREEQRPLLSLTSCRWKRCLAAPRSDSGNTQTLCIASSSSPCQ